MKLVLVTQRVALESSYEERRDALDQRWSQLLAESGFCAVPVPNELAAVGPLLQLPSLAGLVLSGGQSTATYGGDTPERDRVESALLYAAIRTRLPVLGVCRGMQFILEHFGQTLERCDGHVSVDHRVEVRGDGDFAAVLGDAPVVNSYHTLSVRSVAAPLRSVAHAADGSVEAIEHESLPVRAVMWHPERDVAGRSADAESLLRFAFGSESSP